MPAVNSKIVQADYNDIRNKIDTVLGNGSGNSGYGQQARIVSTAVAEGQKVTINEWANLRLDIINAYKYGLRTMYYNNTPNDNEEADASGCSGGACSI